MLKSHGYTQNIMVTGTRSLPLIRTNAGSTRAYPRSWPVCACRSACLAGHLVSIRSIMPAPLHKQYLAWRPAPSNPLASSSEVHVWRLSLNPPRDRLRFLETLLSPAEITRADRFAFPHLRAHYVAARGTLRLILGLYTHTHPAALTIVYAKHGKPHLPGSEVCFNLSHSHELALLSIARGRAVGVDIEHLRPVADANLIAQRFFSPQEVEALLKVHAPLQLRAFFNGWTRKEAYIKALGEGLSHPLHTFDVTLTPGQPARFLAFREAPSEITRWKMLALALGPDYVGAVVAEGQDWQLQCFDGATVLPSQL